MHNFFVDRYIVMTISSDNALLSETSMLTPHFYLTPLPLGFLSLPEISDQMASVCLVIYIRLISNGLNFFSAEEMHRTQTYFQELQRADSSCTVCRPLDKQSSHFQRFGGIFI